MIDDLLLEWAADRAGDPPVAPGTPYDSQPAAQRDAPVPFPVPSRPTTFPAQPPPVEPSAQPPQGGMTLTIPTAPISSQADPGSPYAQLLARAPDLLAGQDHASGGARVPGYPAGAYGRGVMRSDVDHDDDATREYIARTYGPENAQYITSPLAAAKPGDASADEKANWAGANGS